MKREIQVTRNGREENLDRGRVGFTKGNGEREWMEGREKELSCKK